MLIIDNLRALSRTFGFVFPTFRSSNQFAQCLNQCSVWLMQSGAEKNKYRVLSQYRIFFSSFFYAFKCEALDTASTCCFSSMGERERKRARFV